MGKGRERWSDKEILRRSPLPDERQSQPRCDRPYETSENGVRAEFAAEGTVTFDGQTGTWNAEKGIVRLTTPQWYCEGPIGVEELYLTCSRQGSRHRAELRLIISAA